MPQPESRSGAEKSMDQVDRHRSSVSTSLWTTTLSRRRIVVVLECDIADEIQASYVRICELHYTLTFHRSRASISSRDHCNVVEDITSDSVGNGRDLCTWRHRRLWLLP